MSTPENHPPTQADVVQSADAASLPVAPLPEPEHEAEQGAALHLETHNSPEGGHETANSVPLESATSSAEAPERHGNETSQSQLESRFRKLARQKLLTPEPREGKDGKHGSEEAPIHQLARYGLLDKAFINKLSKPAGSKSESGGADSPVEEAKALMEALLTASAALPQPLFEGKIMNVFGAAAAGGHLSQIPDACFTREILLPSGEGNSVHFLEVAKAHDKLLKVPAFIWKRLQRLKDSGLNEAEGAALESLLALLEEVVGHYCKRLEADSSIYHTEIPADLRTEPTLRAVHRAHELKHYERSPIPFEHLPQRFQTGADALHSWSRPWIRLLEADTVSFDKIPAQLRDSAEARTAWATPWLLKLSSEPMASYQIPPELRTAPEAIAARKQFHCGAVSSGDESALRGVPAEIRSEPEVHASMLKGWSVWLASQGLDGWNHLPEVFRSEQSLIEQAADLWTDRIERSDVKWPDIHEEIRSLERVRTSWLERQKLSAQLPASLAEIAALPNVTRATLDLWRHSNHWNRQRAVASLVELRNAPWLFSRLDAAARDHVMIADAAYGGITELVRRHWSYIQLCPADFQAEPDLLELAATEWKAALLEGKIPWEQIPGELHAAPSLAAWKAKQDAKHRAETRRNKQAAIAGRVQSAPHLQDSELTKKELRNTGIRKLRAAYWAKKIAEDRMNYMQIPESLLNIETLQNAMRKQWGPLVHQDPAVFETFPERIREDTGIQRVYRIATRTTEPEATGPTEG
jgi:hypothetical protein